MNTLSKYTLIPFSILLLSVASAESQAATLNVNIGPATTVPDNQAKAVSDDISMVMQEIAKARNSLKSKQFTEAKDELTTAQNTLKAVKDSYGTGIASVTFSAVHHDSNLNFRDAEQETDMRSLQQLDQAKLDMREGHFDSASKIVDAVDYPLTFAEIDLPVGQTSANLNQAIDLINKGQSDKAGTLLYTTQLYTNTDAQLFAGDF
jgi:hypothetical protein